jgi:kynurenine formamidase
MKLIDVSHTIEHEMITYKGLPAPLICDYLTRERSRQLYAPGVEFHIGKIEMIANTGTYVDSPFHRYEQGKDLSQLPLSSLANLDAVVIHTTGRTVELSHLTGHDLRGKAVLIHTGWSRHWRTEQYFEGNPYLTAAAAAYLRDQGALMVGIDSLNIDNTADLARPAHTILLGADIPIVEHLTNLHTLPDNKFRFFAVPGKIKAFGTFPVRAFALL